MRKEKTFKNCLFFSQEELQVLKERLDTERQEYLSNASAYEEQRRLYQELRGEADRAVEQQKTLSGLLDEVDNAKDNLGKEIVELKETNKELKVKIKFLSIKLYCISLASDYLFIYLFIYFSFYRLN